MDWRINMVRRVWLGMTMMALLSTTNVVVGKDLRDPTQPSNYISPDAKPGSTEKTEVKVSAIFISGDQKSAVVNGKIVKEGDDLLGAKITSITPTMIVLENERGKMELKIVTASVLKDVKND